jgi:hypothetical protein
VTRLKKTRSVAKISHVFALRDTKAAPPYRSDALAYRWDTGRVGGAVGPCQMSRAAEIFCSADSRFFSREDVQTCIRVFLGQSSVVRSDATAQKKPRPRSGGAVQSPSSPLIWLAALALTTLVATLPGLLLLLARLLFVGVHTCSFRSLSVRRQQEGCDQVPV